MKDFVNMHVFVGAFDENQFLYLIFRIPVLPPVRWVLTTEWVLVALCHLDFFL